MKKKKLMVEKLVINEKTCAVNPMIVGMPASMIAKMAGVKVPDKYKNSYCRIKRSRSKISAFM